MASCGVASAGEIEGASRIRLPEIRARVLNAAVTQAVAQEGLLFEPQSAGMKTASLTCSTPGSQSGDWNAGLSTEMLLARWLRVNGTVLPLPEPPGLWASLPASCRDWFTRRSVQA